MAKENPGGLGRGAAGGIYIGQRLVITRLSDGLPLKGRGLRRGSRWRAASHPHI